MNERPSTIMTGPYTPPRLPGPIDLHLDANEGPADGVGLGPILEQGLSEAARRYPDAGALERVIAERLGIGAECVLVTAGGDEGIDRACRAFLGPGREIVLTSPTFEMIERHARSAGAEARSAEWRGGAYPVEAVLSLVGVATGMIVVVSPNNPTGAVASVEDLARLCAGAPGTVLLADLAYAEFADEDLTGAALALPRSVVIRTFSKAYGLAGMRVGYAVGAAPLIHAMRCVGSPYPVAGLSVAAALGALRTAGSWLPRNVERIRAERRRLREMLPELGAGSRESQGNFVLGEFRDAEWVWRALAGLGIAVRRFHSGDGLENSLRITCPGEEQGFTRLCAALRTALRPEALLIDMDGVIADVSGSYRRAIALTAESFGAPVTRAQIAGAKSEPGANNDWVVTHRLISRAGVTAGLDEVRWRFEEWYRGTPTRSGLELSERLLPERRALESLAARIPLGIVTGRPRRDCERFLTRFGLRDIFRAVVCMEDAPLKPDPAPVRLAMNRLGVTSAWMIGDTPDDVAAARAAGVAPIGIVAPGDDPGPARLALERAGAARIVSDVSELEAMLP